MVGIFTAGRQALAMVLVQTYVDDAHRGRVMSIFMTQISMVLFGGFIVGLAAEALGIQTAIGGLGLGLAIFTLGVAPARAEAAPDHLTREDLRRGDGAGGVEAVDLVGPEARLLQHLAAVAAEQRRGPLRARG